MKNDEFCRHAESCIAEWDRSISYGYGHIILAEVGNNMRNLLNAAVRQAKAMSASGQDQNAASAVGETDLP